MIEFCKDCMKKDVCKNLELATENLEKIQLTSNFQELSKLGISAQFRCSHFVISPTAPQPKIIGNSLCR